MLEFKTWLSENNSLKMIEKVENKYLSLLKSFNLRLTLLNK